MNSYQSQLGISDIHADTITINNSLIVEGDVNIAGTTIINELMMSNGAVDGYVVTSDSAGAATWQANTPLLNGDVTGLSSNNTVAKVGGQPAGDIVQSMFTVQAATAGNIPDTLVIRDSSGDVSLGETTVRALNINNGVQPDFITLRAPITAALQAQTYTLPIALGNTGDVLSQSDATGSLSWKSKNFDLTGMVTSNGNATTVVTNANLTGMVTSNGNATTVVTNANLTGMVTSVGNATTVVKNANLTGMVTSNGNATTVVTNANLTGMVTSVGNATTVVTNANLTGGVTSVGNATTVVTNANLTGECTSVGNATTLTNSAVIGKVLTGFASGSGTVTATDSILTAIQKLSGPATLIGDCNGSSSSNTVTSLRGNTISIPVATDTLVCKNTSDILTNKTLSAPIVTGIVSTTGAGMTLKQTGDALGTSSIILCNRSGTNGLMVQQNNTTYDLCDIGLYSQLSGQIGVIRLEKRTAALSVGANSTNGELQFKPNTNTASPTFVVGDALSKFLMPLLVNAPIISSNYSAPTVQGAFLAWNRSGSSGRTTFGNQQGGGSGGFEWVNYNNTNAIVGNTPLMSLASDGNLYVSGGLSLVNTAGGTQSLLNHYEEYTYTTQFVGATTSDVITFKMVRIGKLVTMTVVSPSEWTQAVLSNTSTLANMSYFPTRFNPLVAVQFMVNVISGTTNSSYVYGAVTVGGDGIMQIGVGAGQSAFTSTRAGFRAFSASWVVNF